MVEPSMLEVYERLGSLQTSMDGMRRDFAESENRAHESREKVFDRLEDVQTRTAHLERSVSKIEPAVDSLNNLKAKAAGAIIVLGAIGAILGWFAAELKSFLFRPWGGT